MRDAPTLDELYGVGAEAGVAIALNECAVADFLHNLVVRSEVMNSPIRGADLLRAVNMLTGEDIDILQREFEADVAESKQRGILVER